MPFSHGVQINRPLLKEKSWCVWGLCRLRVGGALAADFGFGCTRLQLHPAEAPACGIPLDIVIIAGFMQAFCVYQHYSRRLGLFVNEAGLSVESCEADLPAHFPSGWLCPNPFFKGCGGQVPVLRGPIRAIIRTPARSE